MLQYMIPLKLIQQTRHAGGKGTQAAACPTTVS